MARLEFLGRGPVYSHHLGVPYRVLDVDAEKSLPAKGGKPDLNDNLIIHGDNLHALKALMPVYEGRVKCVYIDPPYNTGNEGWAYNDRVNSPLMQEWLGKVVDREDQCRHDKWLCMMWPRLNILKDLLADDGVIFISIDDNEQHRLRAIMDEIFGEGNFVGSFVWEGTGKNDAKFISVGHDYIISYAKDFTLLNNEGVKWRSLKEGVERIQKIVDDLKNEYGSDYETISDKLQAWYSDIGKKEPPWRHKHYNRVDERGIYFPGDISWPGGGGPDYDVLHPITKKPVRKPARGWSFSSPERMNQMIESGYIHFGKDETRVPNLKRYLHETSGQVLTSVFYQDRRAALKNLRQIFQDDVFEYPKDERVLQSIFGVATSNNDIILDSFAGSGTTAHAVLALNKEDGGNRKFILVECEDEIADKITAERVRRVIKGVPKAKDPALKAGLGGSFTYATLGGPVDPDMMVTGESLPPYEQLARHIFWTATGETLEGKFTERGDGFIGESAKYRLHLIYKPDLEFLGSPEAALTLDRVSALRKKAVGKKRLLVFAAVSYMEEEDLSEHHVTFCQLPWAINGHLGAP